MGSRGEVSKKRLSSEDLDKILTNGGSNSGSVSRSNLNSQN